MTAVVAGFFAAMWFGWGQAEATGVLITLRTVGSALSLILVVAGGVLAFRSPSDSSPMADPAVRRRYNIIVVIEFGLTGLGAVLLGALGASDWIPVWICAVVGVHFYPLATALGDRSLRPLGTALTAVAGLALVLGLGTDVAPVTGVGAGLALLIAGCYALLGPGRAAPEPASVSRRRRLRAAESADPASSAPTAGQRTAAQRTAGQRTAGD